MMKNDKNSCNCWREFKSLLQEHEFFRVDSTSRISLLYPLLGIKAKFLKSWPQVQNFMLFRMIYTTHAGRLEVSSRGGARYYVKVEPG